MSAKVYEVRPGFRPINFPGVNSVAICDCGTMEFRVGIEVDPIGNNHIRCIECVQCAKRLAVPFFDNSLR